MIKIIETNKKALDFALHAVPRMRQLSEPLRQFLGIKGFSYMRTYNDCRYLSLLNGYEEYTKKFFETIPKSDPHFVEAINSTAFGEANYTLWPIAPKRFTPILSLLDTYNLWHGFQITYRSKEYCEMFSFTFDKQSDNKSLFYTKNIPFLIKFVNYFRTQGLDLIEEDIANKLAVFPEKFNTGYVEDYELKEFLSQISKNIALKDSEGGIARLTQRESECLIAFSQNKTCKEIAAALKMAPRTVELHIQNIKHKLKINYKNQLIDIFRSSFLSF